MAEPGAGMSSASSAPSGQAPSAARPGGDAPPQDLIAAARAGDPRVLARLISLVESGAQQRLRPLLREVAPLTGGATVIGLTGAPGVGKSTVTGALIRVYRSQGMRVGVLAVDPTSPFSGGALLGDRVRMQDHATDSGVFIRSMANRGHLGGLSSATPQAVHVLEAAGFEVILIETVGVGQAEVEIAGLADTTLVIVAPGMGDSIQAAKAGVLEIADIFVVNKAERPGAQEAIRDLRTMIAMASRAADAWKPPIVATSAAFGEGIDDLAHRLSAHRRWLVKSGDKRRRRQERAREEISGIAVAELRRRLGALPGEARLDELAAQVARGELDAYTASDSLVEAAPVAVA
ncbi:MAG: methylmalonyl Co-A mutase-associated GTPase MeaB [Streptosporangiaceae bacterium]